MVGPLLKPRHEAFARALVAQIAGKYESQGKAYIAAGFAAQEGNSADAAASRLLRTVKPIAARIVELQAIAAKKKKITVETIVEELEEAREVAKENAQGAAMTAATMGKAKIVGLAVERSETGKPGDFTQANDSASIARSLLKQAGMNESEIGESASLQALEALDHFQKRIAAIVTGTQAIAS